MKTFIQRLKIIIVYLLLLSFLAVMLPNTVFAARKINALDPNLQISVYSGKPYCEVNGNVPFFTPAEKSKKTSFESYSKLDSLGRCGVAYANICKELMPTEKRGKIGSVKPSGWHTVKYNGMIEGNYLYNRCHLIGFQLAGENANPKNLITGTRYLNVDGMLPFEDEVADYVKRTGNHVLYRVTPRFTEDNLVADGVVMEAWSVEDSGKGVSFNVFCYNVQPGFEIDYSNGDNWISGKNKNSASNSSSAGKNYDNSAAKAECYVVNTNTKKFHKETCKSVKDIKAKNKEIYKGSRDELIKKNYQPCKGCNP